VFVQKPTQISQIAQIYAENDNSYSEFFCSLLLLKAPWALNADRCGQTLVGNCSRRCSVLRKSAKSAKSASAFGSADDVGRMMSVQ
jgi:hypothetical protein